MPAPLGNPVFYGWDDDGNPLAGGLLYAYVAGTTTPLDTYTDSTLQTANANPVVLDASGKAEVWCPDDSVYKFILKDSTGVTVWTIDDVAPAQGFPSPYPTQFTSETNPVSYVSATRFKVSGVNVTTTYTAGRIVKTTNTAGTIYSQVKSSSFSTDTTVVVDNLSGSLDSGLSAVAYGIESAINGAVPATNGNASLVMIAGNAGTMTTATNATLGDSTFTGTKAIDTLSEFDTSTGKFTPKATGNYRITVNCGISISGVTFDATAGVTTAIAKNGTAATGATFNHATPKGSGATLTSGGNGSYIYALTGGSDYVTVLATATFSVGSPVPTWAVMIQRV